MPFVNSTAIRRIEYDSDTQTLSIWFTEGGGPYDYYQVPQEVYDRFLRAISKGTFFNDFIRDQYSSNR
mgnify:CR=1 FL=1